ncbi:hypothetical protein [Psychroserpens sp. Hel_I_66]|uniref:hypothetical protein n=1 Tax=Psychroserpens sp. Hel_I_66 TaxID=1250004 RepID=UPI0006473A2A|nr:hypothetical protein [Psychroserpens sp. Hel_I_66]
MDGSLSQFMATLQRRKARKVRNNGKFDKTSLSYNSEDRRPEYSFPELTDKELEEIKGKIKNNLTSHNRLNTIISFTAFIILIIIIYFLIT